jgi:hypothetical protein
MPPTQQPTSSSATHQGNLFGTQALNSYCNVQVRQRTHLCRHTGRPVLPLLAAAVLLPAVLAQGTLGLAVHLPRPVQVLQAVHTSPGRLVRRSGELRGP